MHRALSDEALDGRDVVGAHAILGQGDRAVDEGLRHRAARVGLERQVLRNPALAQFVEQMLKVGRNRRGKRFVEPVRPVQHGSRPLEAPSSHEGRPNARLRGPPRVHAFGPRALGQILDDA